VGIASPAARDDRRIRRPAQLLAPEERAAWLHDAQQFVRSIRQIKAIVYFDADPPGNPPSLSYSIGNDADVVAAIRQLAHGS
jgi:hypothetical protein